MKRKLTPEQQKIVEDNYGLIYGFLKKYNLQEEDYYGVVAIGLCDAAIGYDPKRGQLFSTYAYTTMYHAVLKEIRRNSRQCIIPQDTIIYYNNLPVDEDERIMFLRSNDDVENETIVNLFFEKYLSSLKEKPRQILLLAKEGYSQTQICKRVQCSRPYVEKTKKRFRDAVKRELTY